MAALAGAADGAGRAARCQRADERGGATEKYDTADQRTAFANNMHAAGVDSKAIAARMSADTVQEEPARAVRNGPGKPPVTRKGTPNNSQSRDRQQEVQCLGNRMRQTIRPIPSAMAPPIPAITHHTDFPASSIPMLICGSDVRGIP